MANKNYYETLGIKKDASQDDIKNAYRKMARKYHPDMVKESEKAEAEKKFKEINEAYQVLSDLEKRKMYDQFGTADFNGGAGFSGSFVLRILIGIFPSCTGKTVSS